jgi:hypothetical protein
VTTEPDRQDAPAWTGDAAVPHTPASGRAEQQGFGALAGADIFLRVRHKRIARLPASLRHGRHRAPLGRRSGRPVVGQPEPTLL